MKLTGKSIWESFETAGFSYESLPEDRQQAYEQAAKKMQESHLAPLHEQIEQLKADIKQLRDVDRTIADEQDKEIKALQGLLKEYMALVEVRLGALNPAGPLGWPQQAIELEKRAYVLLKEQKG